MKREQIEALVGHKITDAEWLDACELLEFIERHPDAEAVFDRCIARGLSVEETNRRVEEAAATTQLTLMPAI